MLSTILRTKSFHISKSIFSPQSRYRFSRVSALCLLIASQSIRLSSSTNEVVQMKKEYSNISLLGQKDAIQIDVDLMSEEGGFSIDQLMELAGLSCAVACTQAFPPPAKTVMVICGPGNNGGDGLVAARHLVHFGYFPVVVYPKQPRNPLYEGLVKQLKGLNVPIVKTIREANEVLVSKEIGSCNKDNEDKDGDKDYDDNVEKQVSPPRFDGIIDAVFGFSFKGEPRAPFDSVLKEMRDTGVKVLSVDVPSGWDVEQGDKSENLAHHTGFHPYGLISLTAPKKCTKEFKGRHWLGGRFVPPYIVEKYGLNLPSYEGVSQVVELTENKTPITNDVPATPVPTELSDHDGLFEENIDDYSVVWITAPPQEAKALASKLVTTKLAACVNIMPSVTSVYFWDGKAMDDEESLLMVKTRSSLLSQLTEFVQTNHSYVVPETIAVKLAGGNRNYLEWIKENTQEKNKK